MGSCAMATSSRLFNTLKVFTLTNCIQFKHIQYVVYNIKQDKVNIVPDILNLIVHCLLVMRLSSIQRATLSMIFKRFQHGRLTS